MIVNKTFPRETRWLTTENLRDIADLEIISLLTFDPEIPDTDVCWLLGVPGGRVTAMREALEATDADAL